MDRFFAVDAIAQGVRVALISAIGYFWCNLNS